MYEWGIAESNSKISILQTHGIITCVGVSFYNNQTKQAVLSHFAVTSDYSDAKKMINMIIKVLIFDNLDTKLDVNIVHNKKNDSIFDNIYNILSKIENILIKNVIDASMLAINANTGEISTVFEPNYNTNTRSNLGSYRNLEPIFNDSFNNSMQIIKNVKLIKDQFEQEEKAIEYKNIIKTL